MDGDVDRSGGGAVGGTLVEVGVFKGIDHDLCDALAIHVLGLVRTRPGRVLSLRALRQCCPKLRQGLCRLP